MTNTLITCSRRRSTRTAALRPANRRRDRQPVKAVCWEISHLGAKSDLPANQVLRDADSLRRHRWAARPSATRTSTPPTPAPRLSDSAPGQHQPIAGGEPDRRSGQIRGHGAARARQRGSPSFAGPRRQELIADPTGKVGGRPVRHKPREACRVVAKGIVLLPAFRAIAKMERDRSCFAMTSSPSVNGSSRSGYRHGLLALIAFTVFLERLTQSFAARATARHHGPNRKLRGFRDFLVAHVLELSEHDDFAIDLAEPGKRCAHRPSRPWL